MLDVWTTRNSVNAERNYISMNAKFTVQMKVWTTRERFSDRTSYPVWTS